MQVWRCQYCHDRYFAHEITKYLCTDMLLWVSPVRLPSCLRMAQTAVSRLVLFLIFPYHYFFILLFLLLFIPFFVRPLLFSIFACIHFFIFYRIWAFSLCIYLLTRSFITSLFSILLHFLFSFIFLFVCFLSRHLPLVQQRHIKLGI